MTGHGKIICSCGIVIAQCRCFNHGDKVVTIVRAGCAACKARPKFEAFELTAADSVVHVH